MNDVERKALIMVFEQTIMDIEAAQKELEDWLNIQEVQLAYNLLEKARANLKYLLPEE